MHLFYLTLIWSRFNPPDRSDPFSIPLTTDIERRRITSQRFTTWWSNWSSSFRNDRSHWSTILRALGALQALRISDLVCRIRVSDRYMFNSSRVRWFQHHLSVLPTEHAAMILMHFDRASIESIGNVLKYIGGMLPFQDMRLVQPKSPAPAFIV